MGSYTHSFSFLEKNKQLDLHQTQRGNRRSVFLTFSQVTGAGYPTFNLNGG